LINNRVDGCPFSLAQHKLRASRNQACQPASGNPALGISTFVPRSLYNTNIVYHTHLIDK